MSSRDSTPRTAPDTPRRGGSRPAARFLLVVVAALLATADALGLTLVAAAAGAAPTSTSGTTSAAPADGTSARVGALFTGAVGPGHHFCSASVLQSPTRNLVLTAAHCVGGARTVLFAPGYRDGVAPYGVWRVTRVHTTAGWSADRDEDEDVAVLETAPADGREVEDAVGGLALGLEDVFTRQVHLYGYPSRGEQPLLCTAGITVEPARQHRIACPGYPGGTSGGPWISTRTGEIVGVIGGHQEGGDTADVSYSPFFGQAVAGLYRAAVTGSD